MSAEPDKSIYVISILIVQKNKTRHNLGNAKKENEVTVISKLLCYTYYYLIKRLFNYGVFYDLIVI